MAEKYLNDPAPAWAESQGALRTFAFWGVPTLLGLALAVALQLFVIFPRMGAGSADLDRCVALGTQATTAWPTSSPAKAPKPSGNSASPTQQRLRL